jgi:hypothetical protein
MKKHILLFATIIGIFYSCKEKYETIPIPQEPKAVLLNNGSEINGFVTGYRFAASDTVEVDILGGQSNAGGYGLITDLPAYLKDTLKGCWIYYPSSHKIEELMYNRNTCAPTGKHGLELSYTYNMKLLNGKERVLVKYGPYGTYLKDSSGIQDWNVNSYHEYYFTLTTNYVKKAATILTGEGKVIKYKNFIWYQGPEDMLEYKASSLYYSNLIDLCNKVKLDYPGINIVIVREHNNGRTYSSVIRAADSTLCATYGYDLVSTDMYHPTWLHLNSADQVNLGNDLANLLYNR